MIFETVSFHIVKPCNMKCKFCYATFNDMHIKVMNIYDAFTIVEKLAKAGVQKITFAGGEPMLYKELDMVIMHAKELGMTTSIITNGSLINTRWLDIMKYKLDWIGISIDSVNYITNYNTGRDLSSGFVPHYKLIDDINERGYKLKINTVVNKYNKEETIVDFIERANPSRWKVFQALRVEGQNDKQFEEIKVSDEEFNEYIERNHHPAMVVESNKLMTGSYLLVDPQGRLFENSQGKHTYSDSLINTDIETCLSQINLDREMFEARGGIYQW